jgi:hypothetical protein
MLADMYVVSHVEMAEMILRHPQYVSDLLQIPVQIITDRFPEYIKNTDQETLRWLYQEIQDLIQITNNYEKPRV